MPGRSVREEARGERADAARNRQRVLDAAQRVFAEFGLEAGLDQIAHRADVGVGTVYRRFPDKAALIEALYLPRLESLARIDERLRHEGSWGDLVRLLTRAIELQISDRGLRQVVSGDERVPGPVRERLEGLTGEVAPVVESLLARARARGEVRADLTVDDLTLAHAVVHTSDSRRWRRHLRLVLDGLEPARGRHGHDVERASANRRSARAARPNPQHRWRDQQGERSVRELRAVALNLMLERGFDQVSVDDIVAGAEVSQRSFFRYFSSKEEVVLGLLETGDEGMVRLLAAGSPRLQAALDERLRELRPSPELRRPPREPSR